MNDADEIAHLQRAADNARIQLQDALGALDRFKVKCPTCRCRILPGATCGCCLDLPDVEPSI